MWYGVVWCGFSSDSIIVLTPKLIYMNLGELLNVMVLRGLLKSAPLVNPCWWQQRHRVPSRALKQIDVWRAGITAAEECVGVQTRADSFTP